MVPYEFYLAAYRGGLISAQDWPAAEREACATLARYKRLYTVTAPPDIVDAESMAVCAMAEALAFNAQAEAGQGAVSSTSIGSVSTSYAGASGLDMSAKAQAKRVYNACALYLDIYRGCG